MTSHNSISTSDYHFTGVDKFFEFGPITNLGALSSTNISQLDVYHGRPGKACCLKYKHPLFDRFLQAHYQGNAIQMNRRERYLYQTQLGFLHRDGFLENEESDFITYEGQELSIEYRVPPLGVFRRLPHEKFQPLKSIIFHGDEITGSLKGLCFSNGEKSFKAAMDQKIIKFSPAEDDKEPYQTNLVRWSSPQEGLSLELKNCQHIHQTWLSKNEYFAYADIYFEGLFLRGVQFHKIRICIID